MTTGVLAGAGSGALLLLAALYFGVVATTVILPFVLVSVARSLRGIRDDLDRIAGAALVIRRASDDDDRAAPTAYVAGYRQR